MSRYEYTFHNLPPMKSFHFTYAPTADGSRAEQRHAEIVAILNQLKRNQGITMERIDDILQNLDDMLALITAEDAEAAALRKQVADLIAAANISAAEKAALQGKIDTAWDKSEAAENKLRARVPQVPPVGGVALASTHANRADFDAAVAAYTGPEGVTLSGASVKSGTGPTIDFFEHSADGLINTSGPSD